MFWPIRANRLIKLWGIWSIFGNLMHTNFRCPSLVHDFALISHFCLQKAKLFIHSSSYLCVGLCCIHHASVDCVYYHVPIFKVGLKRKIDNRYYKLRNLRRLTILMRKQISWLVSQILSTSQILKSILRVKPNESGLFGQLRTLGPPVPGWDSRPINLHPVI